MPGVKNCEVATREYIIVACETVNQQGHHDQVGKVGGGEGVRITPFMNIQYAYSFREIGGCGMKKSHVP